MDRNKTFPNPIVGLYRQNDLHESKTESVKVTSSGNWSNIKRTLVISDITLYIRDITTRLYELMA